MALELNFVSARTNKRHHHHRVQAGVLRMHNFKRFAHHSLSRASVHVQSVTSLTAEETPVAGICFPQQVCVYYCRTYYKAVRGGLDP